MEIFSLRGTFFHGTQSNRQKKINPPQRGKAQKLWRRGQDMEKEAFGKLILENEQQLYRIAKSILRQDEDCADAAQEAIAKAFEKLPGLRNDAYAKTWLIRILIHECCNLSKRRSREVSFDETWLQGQPGKETYSGLYEALASLPEEFRVVLVLHYLEGFDLRETGEMLQLSLGTVKSRLHRARKLLEEE